MKTAIENELTNYRNKFSNKIYCDENNDTDILMDIFCISPALKRDYRVQILIPQCSPPKL